MIYAECQKKCLPQFQITLIEKQQKIYTWSKERERERNVLFNDALNTFYLRLYGIRHMVKDHSDSEKGTPLPPHRLLLSINSKGSFICTIPDRITHTTAFVTPVVEHWLEREIATWSKMDWKDHYVNVINTKNDNHTTSDNNVGHSDVRYKNQTSTSWTINRAHRITEVQWQIRLIATDHPLPQYVQKLSWCIEDM